MRFYRIPSQKTVGLSQNSLAPDCYIGPTSKERSMESCRTRQSAHGKQAVPAKDNEEPHDSLGY